MVRVRSVLVVAMAMLVGCNSIDMVGLVAPTGDVVNTRFEKSMSLSGGRSVACIDEATSYQFYVCADPHVGQTSANLQAFATQMRDDSSAAFGVVLGDCTDQRDVMPVYAEAIAGSSAADAPVFSLIGNHDLFFSGWDDYYKLLGPSVYWFEVSYGSGKDLFITLDSASGTLGRKQMEWLKELLATRRGEYRHCVVFTHTNLFYTDNSQTGSGNMAMEETCLLTDLLSRHNVTLCLQGHDHYREDLTFGDVRYTIVGTIRDEADNPEYLIVKMSADGAEYLWRYL